MLNGQKEKTKELGTRNALNTNSKYISTHVKYLHNIKNLSKLLHLKRKENLSQVTLNAATWVI